MWKIYCKHKHDFAKYLEKDQVNLPGTCKMHGLLSFHKYIYVYINIDINIEEKYIRIIDKNSVAAVTEPAYKIYPYQISVLHL